jgi:SAM-dependent methyltransferase
LDGEVLAGREVLDVGAGLGFDAYNLARAGARVTAMEFSPVSAREGRKRLPMMRWIGGMSHILPFNDSSFDYVFANAALHHMRDVPAAIEEMLRVLRPGGFLITTGDPYRADRLGEADEIAIFNRHPDVLLGINEGVPRLRELVDVLERVRGKIEPQLFTQMVYEAWRVGGGKTIDEFREWNFDADVTGLRGTSGSVAMKVKLCASLNEPPKIQAGGRLLRAAELAGWMTSQSKAMAELSAWAPENVLNRPFPGNAPSKFELLNGWQASTGKQWRQAYRRARWYLRRTEAESRLTFELQAMRPCDFEIMLNGETVRDISVGANNWAPISLDLGSLPAGVPFAVEIRMKGEPDTFDNGLFRVRRRRFLHDGQSVKPAFFENAAQRLRAAFGA